MAPITTATPAAEEPTHPLQLSAWMALVFGVIGTLTSLGQLWFAWAAHRRSTAAVPVDPPNIVYAPGLLAAAAHDSNFADKGVLLCTGTEVAAATGAPQIPAIPNITPIGSLAAPEYGDMMSGNFPVETLTGEDLPWYGIGAGEIILVPIWSARQSAPNKSFSSPTSYLEESTSIGTQNPAAVARFHRERLVFPTFPSSGYSFSLTLFHRGSDWSQVVDRIELSAPCQPPPEAADYSVQRWKHKKSD